MVFTSRLLLIEQFCLYITYRQHLLMPFFYNYTNEEERCLRNYFEGTEIEFRPPQSASMGNMSFYLEVQSVLINFIFDIFYIPEIMAIILLSS